MDINKFARLVTLREGKRKSISIAQVKEVLKIAREIISERYGYIDLYKVIRRTK